MPPLNPPCPHHELIMGWIVQPYAQDACGLGSSTSPAPGGAEHRSGINIVELRKLHQIASPVADLHHPSPNSFLSLISSPPNCRQQLIVA